MNKITDVVEYYFRDLLYEIDSQFDSFRLAVVYDDRWSNPLPDEVRPMAFTRNAPDVIIISIDGWTREESYYDEDTESMYIKTAFGDKENEAWFNSSDILGIFDSNGELVYIKTYYIKEDAEEKPGSFDNEAVNRSMEIMLKKNKHLLGRKNAK